MTGPEIAAELRAHADNLETGRLKWVGHTPQQLTEACLLLRGGGGRWYGKYFYVPVLYALTAETRDYLNEFVVNKARRRVAYWNDYVCSDVAEAVLMLRLAADAAEVEP